jgi:hypothetical protein
VKSTDSKCLRLNTLTHLNRALICLPNNNCNEIYESLTFNYQCLNVQMQRPIVFPAKYELYSYIEVTCTEPTSRAVPDTLTLEREVFTARDTDAACYTVACASTHPQRSHRPADASLQSVPSNKIHLCVHYSESSGPCWI